MMLFLIRGTQRKNECFYMRREFRRLEKKSGGMLDFASFDSVTKYIDPRYMKGKRCGLPAECGDFSDCL